MKIPFVGVYETFSNLYGYTVPKDRLVQYVQSVPLGGVLTVLSQFNSLTLNEKNVKKDLMSFLEKQFSASFSKTKIEIDRIYSKQGLLSTWKWLLAYGNLNHLGEEVVIEDGINIVLMINLMVSDYLYDTRINKENYHYDHFTNAVFNADTEFGSALARSVLIFDKISSNPQNFNANDYIDIHTPFQQKYGYTIKEYLTIVFGLIAGFLRRGRNGISSDWVRSSNYFSNIPLATGIADSIIDELSMSIQEARDWSLQTIDQPWDYTRFRQKPILKLDNGNFLPINLEFLNEKVFSELYFKIRAAFPDNSSQIISFYGKCFEKYVENLAEHSANDSRIPYIFVPEFQYESNSKRSPDVLIRLGNSMLAIEAKVYRLKMDSVIGGIDSSDVIDKDIEKMAIKPIKQLHDRTKELIQRNHEAFNGIEKLYFISVTFGNLPTLKQFEMEIEEELKQYFTIPVNYHFHLDIEEFELLMELISRPNASPVFRFLETKNKDELFKHMSLKNYLFRGCFRPKRPRYILNQLEGVIKDFKRFYELEV